MVKRYEYLSNCCGHNYIEVRDSEMEMIHPKCNVCQQGEYELTAETVLEN